MQVLMAKSFQYEEPARLAVLNYCQPVMQLGLDMIFFHMEFSGQQLLGAGVILASNFIGWASKNMRHVFKKKTINSLAPATEMNKV